MPNLHNIKYINSFELKKKLEVAFYFFLLLCFKSIAVCESNMYWFYNDVFVFSLWNITID